MGFNRRNAYFHVVAAGRDSHMDVPAGNVPHRQRSLHNHRDRLNDGDGTLFARRHTGELAKRSSDGRSQSDIDLAPFSGTSNHRHVGELPQTHCQSVNQNPMGSSADGPYVEGTGVSLRRRYTPS